MFICFLFNAMKSALGIWILMSVGVGVSAWVGKHCGVGTRIGASASCLCALHQQKWEQAPVIWI